MKSAENTEQTIENNDANTTEDYQWYWLASFLQSQKQTIYFLIFNIIYTGSLIKTQTL